MIYWFYLEVMTGGRESFVQGSRRRFDCWVLVYLIVDEGTDQVGEVKRRKRKRKRNRKRNRRDEGRRSRVKGRKGRDVRVSVKISEMIANGE